jgi:hypothetical protein
MPIHDWSGKPVGLFHHFHQRWAGSICDALNAGRLPKGFYALETPIQWHYREGEAPSEPPFQARTEPRPPNTFKKLAESLLSEKFGQLIVTKLELRLIVFDAEQKRAIQWIESSNTA